MPLKREYFSVILYRFAITKILHILHTQTEWVAASKDFWQMLVCVRGDRTHAHPRQKRKEGETKNLVPPPTRNDRHQPHKHAATLRGSSLHVTTPRCVRRQSVATLSTTERTYSLGDPGISSPARRILVSTKDANRFNKGWGFP